jgi:DSF synthase
MGVIELVSSIRFSRVEANFQTNQHCALWVTMTQSPAGRSQYFSLDLLHDLCELHTAIKNNAGNWVVNGAKRPIHYVVMKSAHPDYFSLGGDLSHFRECIRNNDKKSLRDYSMLCVDMIYDMCTVFNQSATTIALIQGRALGGGFEGALAADFIIAEEHSEFGFPEILFGLFPCTGGMSLLARRVGVHQAERMMINGKIYSATELKDMGVVDAVCSKGQGIAAVDKFIANHSKQRVARQLLQRSRHRLARLDYEELSMVVDEWADAAMNLAEPQLRVMDMLINLQRASVAA